MYIFRFRYVKKKKKLNGRFVDRILLKTRPGSRGRRHRHTPRAGHHSGTEFRIEGFFHVTKYFSGFHPQTNGAGKKQNATLSIGVAKFEFV